MARTVVIRKIIMLPKLKAAALFQPEDHVNKCNLKRTLLGKPRTTWAMRNISKGGLGAIHYGGIFGSGTLLFVGQEFMLGQITGRHEDLDAAPPLASGLAGSFGGTPAIYT